MIKDATREGVGITAAPEIDAAGSDKRISRIMAEADAWDEGAAGKRRRPPFK
jgi:hypothetical protein